MPTRSAQNRCSASEIISGPLSHRSPRGAPRTANTRPSSATSSSPVMERSTTCSSDPRVCSSTIDAIFTARPSTVESNGKSNAHTAQTRRNPGQGFLRAYHAPRPWCRHPDHLRFGRAAAAGCGSMQPDDSAGEPFGHALDLQEHVHSPPLDRRAQNFPLAISRSASFSSSASASSRSSLAFCSRSSSNSLAASVSIPPYRRLQLYNAASDTCRSAAISSPEAPAAVTSSAQRRLRLGHPTNLPERGRDRGRPRLSRHPSRRPPAGQHCGDRPHPLHRYARDGARQSRSPRALGLRQKP